MADTKIFYPVAEVVAVESIVPVQQSLPIATASAYEIPEMKGIIPSSTSMNLVMTNDGGSSELTIEQRGKIPRLRSLAHLAILSSTVACITPGTMFSPPFDWILVFSLWILILDSTSSQKRDRLLEKDKQNDCCGIRHAYGLSVSSIVFTVMFACGRIGGTVGYFLNPTYGYYDMTQIQAFPQWRSSHVAFCIMQAIATLATGFTIYYLLLISALTIRDRSKQCIYPPGVVLHDPTYPQALANQSGQCPKLLTFMIIIPSIVVMILVLLRLPPANPVVARAQYCDWVKDSYFIYPQYLTTNNKDCCQNVKGIELSCTIPEEERFVSYAVSEARSYYSECSCIDPSVTSVASRDVENACATRNVTGCIPDSDYGCKNFTAFIPLGDAVDPNSLVLNTIVDEFFNAKAPDAPICYAPSGTNYCPDTYWGKLPKTTSSYGYTLRCPKSAYTCKVINTIVSKPYCMYNYEYSWFPNVGLFANLKWK